MKEETLHSQNLLSTMRLTTLRLWRRNRKRLPGLLIINLLAMLKRMRSQIPLRLPQTPHLQLQPHLLPLLKRLSLQLLLKLQKLKRKRLKLRNPKVINLWYQKKNPKQSKRSKKFRSRIEQLKNKKRMLKWCLLRRKKQLYPLKINPTNPNRLHLKLFLKKLSLQLKKSQIVLLPNSQKKRRKLFGRDPDLEVSPSLSL